VTTQCAIYTRISQDTNGQRDGVTRQLDDCQALAERLGWDVAARFDDNDLSAFNGKRRPGFEALLDAMKAGQFGALICWHTDRLYRSMKDLERLIEIADKRGIQIRTVNGGDLDLSTSAGRMLARILGSVARQESEHKGERQKRANVQKAQSGRWQTANRTFGYTMTGEPLEPEATMLRQAVADVLAGKSISQVAREWNASGVKTTLAGTTQERDGKTFVVQGVWNSPRVRRLLVNPRYAALRVHRGKVVGPGDWEALIDADTHRGLVAFLSDPARIICTSFEKKHIGSGVYRCGVCGAPMRHSVPGGRQPGGRRYECRENQCVVRTGAPLDDYVEAVVLARLTAPDVPVLVGSDTRVDVTVLQSRRAALQARLDELAAMFAKGDIDGSQLRRGTTELREQMTGVDRVLADSARTSPLAALVAAGDALAGRWEKLTPDLKGKIIEELMTVRVMKAPRGRPFDPEYIRIEWKTP